MASANPSVDCVTKVELYISCQGLKNKDVMSKSDPIAVLYCYDGQRWREVNAVYLDTNNFQFNLMLIYMLIMLEF